MKKLLLSLGLIGAFVGSTFAANQALTLNSGVMTNFPTSGGPVRITQIIVTAAGTNFSTNFSFVSTYTNWLFYTNAAYTNISSYGTNYTWTYTNYYGVTNSYTNAQPTLVDITNSVAATTNNFPIFFTGTVGSNNVSVKADNLNMYFPNGLWITNSGPGAITIVPTYQQ